jgi:hypothetical protein
MNKTNYFGWTDSKTSIIVFILDTYSIAIHNRLHTIFLINLESGVACYLIFFFEPMMFCKGLNTKFESV